MSILSKASCGVSVESSAQIKDVLPALALYRAGVLLGVPNSVVLYRDLLRQKLVGIQKTGEYPYPGWYGTVDSSGGYPRLRSDWRELFVPADDYLLKMLGLVGMLLRMVGECCGCEVYLVGGAVRELVRNGFISQELDVVLGVHPLKVSHCIVEAGLRIVRTYPLSVKAEYGRYLLDFTFARYDYYPKPGRMPVVVKSDLLADLERRDFTAFAVALIVYPRLGWVDPFRGLESLRQGRLKLVRDYAFMEDPARIVRLVKYSVKCGFEIESHTAYQARKALLGIHGYISRRLWLELKNLFMIGGAEAVEKLGRYGFWEAVLGVPVERVLSATAKRGWYGLVELAKGRYEKLGFSRDVIRSIFAGI